MHLLITNYFILYEAEIPSNTEIDFFAFFYPFFSSIWTTWPQNIRTIVDLANIYTVWSYNMSLIWVKQLKVTNSNKPYLV